MTTLNYKNTITYHGVVKLPNFNGIIFNHGTQSKNNTRTANHINDCKAVRLTYNVLEEKQDRLFGTDVIAPSYDKDFIIRVVNRLNSIVLNKSTEKAATLKNWFKSLAVLSPIDRGYYDAIRLANLSETECCFIPNTVSTEQLLEAIKYVEDTWYYKTKSLRVSAKPYSAQTLKERKMASKPLPEKAFSKVLALIKHKKKFVELLNYKTAYIQSILYAWNISSQDCFRNLNTITVIITGDDKEKYRALYEIMKVDDRFTFVECESDLDVAEAYKEMSIKTDLILSNPPYGKTAAVITRDIIDNIDFKVFINLMPMNDYRATDLKIYEHVYDMYSLGYDAFGGDAKVTTHLCEIKKANNGLSLAEFEQQSYIDPTLTKYFKAIEQVKCDFIDNASSWFVYDKANQETDILLPHQFKYNLRTYKYANGKVRDKHLPLKKTCIEYLWNHNLITIGEIEKINLSPSTPGKVNKYCIKAPNAQVRQNIIKFLDTEEGFKFVSKILMALNSDSTVLLNKWFPKPVDANGECWASQPTVTDLLSSCGYAQSEVDEVLKDLAEFDYLED